jgi:replication factor C small subunit
MSLEALMWVEKYRPHKIDELVNQEEVKERLKPLLEKKDELPHLLFAGPPGSGKTTMALVLARELLGELVGEYSLSLNASDERGIDAVRDRIKTFASYSDRREGVPFRLVILDEADEMCLHPETKIMVGTLDDPREKTLKELLSACGDEFFDIPTFNTSTLRPENDKGKIIQSGTAGLYKVSFEDGRTILASAEHPFFELNGTNVNVLRTKDLHSGSELADFANRFLRCYQCKKTFYRQYPTDLYEHYFCSQDCRDIFLGSMSRNRSPDERLKISQKAQLALRRAGTLQAVEYRRRRSAITKELVEEGRIPDPLAWKKFKKGEGAWLGKKLSEDHKRAIGDGDRAYFREHPEVVLRVNEKVKKALANPDGAYRKLVESGFFKELSPLAFLASQEYWKKNRFRSKVDMKMAELLDGWKVPYKRERLIFTNDRGHHYPFVLDFLIGERVALLVNGCRWHVCPVCRIEPRYEKQRRNMEKDLRHIAQLEAMGYKVAIVWEHELKDEKTIHEQVLPRVFQTVGISGGGLPRIRHSKVKSIEYFGKSEVLNISVVKNRNFFLANGILTHNTRDAQTALRRIMEETSRHTRFVLICNYSSNLIEPIQSRCAIFRFKKIGQEEVAARLKKIAKAEEVKVAEKVLQAISVAVDGDLRQGINLLQAAAAGAAEITLEKVSAVTGTNVREKTAEIVRLALGGDFPAARLKLVELTRVYGIPESDFLRFANEEIAKGEGERTADAIRILAEYDYRLAMGANPEVQLTALLAELAALRPGGDGKSK